jgi:MFS family permease
MTSERKLIRRNILFQSLDSGIFSAGMIFFHQMTIMVAFVKNLYDSPLIIGLIPAVLVIGFNLPGLFTTIIAEKYPIRKDFIKVFAGIQRLCILFMALSTLLFEPFGAEITLFFVLLFYFGFSIFGGMGSPAWLDFNAKTIPVQFRARTNSFRALITGFGGIILPLLINYIITGFNFPENYRINFLAGFFMVFVSYICFLLISETEHSPVVKKKTYRKYFSSLKRILYNDKHFRRFLFAQGVFSISEFGVAFYTYYALDVFHVSESTVVLYAFLFNLSYAVSGLILGFLGDKKGNLNVIRIGSLSALAALLLVILIPSYNTFYIVFILAGISNTAKMNSFQVFITEYGNNKERIRYSVLSTTMSTSMFGITPLLGGILLSLKILTYTGLFAAGAFFAAFAFILFVFVVKDPRFLEKKADIL